MTARLRTATCCWFGTGDASLLSERAVRVRGAHSGAGLPEPVAAKWRWRHESRSVATATASTATVCGPSDLRCAVRVRSWAIRRLRFQVRGRCIPVESPRV